jgi:dihydrofolate synthase/folylpolyglutamate synthase
VDERERILVNGRPIPPEALRAWNTRIRPLADALDASPFEAMTALAFADFASRGVDLAVVEVGLGGRLDSTNVLTPLVSVVSQIARDHTEYLGGSLQAIAREKAGIAKAGVPFVVGERDPGLARVLSREAVARGATARVVPPELEWRLPLGLAGGHQRRNAAVAAAVLELLPPGLRPPAGTVARAFAGARLPGRFERRGKWIFDVAHNPSGIEVLVQALAGARPARPLHALVGILGDKDWRRMLRLLAPAVDRLWLTDPPTAPPERRWDLAAVGLAAGRLGGSRVVVQPDFARALGEVQQGAAAVLVAGSFHTVGDALARLPGFAPLG